MVGQGQRRRGAYEVEKGQDNVFCSPALAPRGGEEARERRRALVGWVIHIHQDIHHIHIHTSRARCEMVSVCVREECVYWMCARCVWQNRSTCSAGRYVRWVWVRRASWTRRDRGSEP